MENKESQNRNTEIKHTLIQTAKDLLVAVIIMVIVLSSLWAYTGNWPPIVVVESNSMMHGEDSDVGKMDTGDILLLKSVSTRQEIKTYIEGKKSNYKTYGSFGDVIAFKKNGYSGTPIIHRAVVWVEYNASGHNDDQTLRSYGSFDIPSLGLYNVTRFSIPDYKPNHINLNINLNQLLSNFRNYNCKPHSGYLTKGDNNKHIDQLSTIRDSKGRPLEPVKIDWVMGKAEGELPWFGLIKLYVTGATSEPNMSPPPTSVNMLILTISLIITLIIIYYLFSYIKTIKREKKGEEVVKNHLTYNRNIFSRLLPKKSTNSEVNTNKEIQSQTPVAQRPQAPLAIPQATVSGKAPRAIPVAEDNISKPDGAPGQ